jgi:Flp pilus assembly protein TadG
MRVRSLRLGRRPGATVPETALVIGIFLTLLLSIFEYGRFVMVRHLVDNAAREGARLAVVSTNTKTTQDIKDEVQSRLAGQQLTGLTIDVYKSDADGNSTGAWSDAAFGEPICVSLAGKYKPMLPSFGFLHAEVNVPVKVIMRSEANN